MLSQSYSDATKGKEMVFHYVCFKVAQYYELKVAVIAIKLIIKVGTSNLLSKEKISDVTKGKVKVRKKQKLSR